jgi:poly(3-hydroxybutyrate) depolymerase
VRIVEVWHKQAMVRWPLLACLLLLVACSESAAPPLPKLGARLDQTSVSGLSSGAYMAGQFQMAHGEIVVGAALIAGGPYGCAESAFAGLMPGPAAAIVNFNKAVAGCMRDTMRYLGVPDAAWLAEKARRRAEAGEIDPIATLTDDRVYLYTGQSDRTVVRRIVERAADVYRSLGVPGANISFIDDGPAGHAFVTESEGIACGTNGAPYVTDCDYDQAGALLKHIYGSLAPPSTKSQGQLLRFDQSELFTGRPQTGMAGTGTAYIPDNCRQTPGCRIHVAFHGCGQNESQVGNAFTTKTGFARWADTNRLIVLFPQADASVVNPQGCWDWWGYTGGDFLTRSAPQIRAVQAMLERLAEPRSRS